MPEEFDEIERALEEAKRKVAESYRDAPSRQDLVSRYELTEDEIDGLEEELKARLGGPAGTALGIKGVYPEHLHQALHGKKRRPRPEVLLEDVRDRIEQGPARQLRNELVKQGPKEVTEAVLASMRDRPETAWEPPGEPAEKPIAETAGEPPWEPTGEPPVEPTPKRIDPFAPRACDVAELLQQDVGPVFTEFPAPTNDLERVGAARKLAYVVAVGEDMRVLDAAATLRDRWADGQYEFCDVNLRNNLYCDMRSCDCGILPEAEKQALYAAVFGLTGEDLPAGSRVNRGFFGMWERFNDTVLRFLMSDGTTEASARTKQEGIFAATMDLQSNLAAHVSEVDVMRIIELYEQLRRELRLFNDPLLFDTVAPGCNAGWWEVVERLTGTPQDGRSVIAAYELARRRDSIFKWVEEFDFADRPPGALFREMVDAVSALSGSAPWMPAMVAQDRPAIAGRSDQLRPVYPQLEPARSAG
jgi:hypothetical protein